MENSESTLKAENAKLKSQNQALIFCFGLSLAANIIGELPKWVDHLKTGNTAFLGALAVCVGVAVALFILNRIRKPKR